MPLGDRRAAHESPAPLGHLPHAEPRIGDPLAADVGEIPLEMPRAHHAVRSANPGTSPLPRASRTDRSTASGTASWTSASGWSGVRAATAAVLTAHTPSPANALPEGTKRRASA